MKKNDIVALSAEQKTSVLGSIMGEITRRKIEPDVLSEERASVANTEMSSFNVDDVIQFNDELIKSVQAKMKTDKYVFAFKVRKDAENTVPVTFVLDGNGKPKLFYLSCMRKRVSEYKDPALAGQLPLATGKTFAANHVDWDGMKPATKFYSIWSQFPNDESVVKALCEQNTTVKCTGKVRVKGLSFNNSSRTAFQNVMSFEFENMDNGAISDIETRAAQAADAPAQ